MIQDKKWLESIITVSFDNEEGQVVSFIYPENNMSEYDIKKITFYSFPDTNVFSDQGSLYFSFKLKSQGGEDLNCYAYFEQRKDNDYERGYFQKSIVLVSKLQLNSIFRILLGQIYENYYQQKQDNKILQYAYDSIQEFPEPRQLVEKLTFILTFFDKKIEFHIESFDYLLNFQTSNDFMFVNKLQQTPKINLMSVFYQDINIYAILGYDKIDVIYKLWEIMMLNKSLLVISDLPLISSDLVKALIGSIFPLEYQGEYFPYLSIFDSAFTKIQKSENQHINYVIGATNPLILKSFQNIGCVLRLDEFFEKKLKNYLVHTSSANRYIESGTYKPRIKSNNTMTDLLTEETNNSEIRVNNMIVRKKLFELSLNFLEPFQIFFAKQKDEKFFEASSFCKFLKNQKFDIFNYFHSKTDCIGFYSDFMITNNFEYMMETYFDFLKKK